MEHPLEFESIRFYQNSFTSTSVYACYFRWYEKGDPKNLTRQSGRKVDLRLSDAPIRHLGSPVFASPVFQAAFCPDRRIQHIVVQS